MINSSLFDVKAPERGNSIVYSNFCKQDYCSKATTLGIGIKYVINGVENYCINNTTISVEANRYLLIKKGKDYEVSLDYSNQPI